jgi:hypothetical protein
MIYLDVISKINAESKHASGLDLPCLAGKAEEVRSRNSEVGSRKSEVGTRKSELGSQKWPSSAIVVLHQPERFYACRSILKSHVIMR